MFSFWSGYQSIDDLRRNDTISKVPLGGFAQDLTEFLETVPRTHPLNSEAADGTCLQNIVAICYCYNAIIYNTIVVAWCICSNMNIINGCDTYYQKYHGMNTHGILKLLDWMDCVRWFLQFLPSLLTPATFTVQGASTPCPYQGWQVSVDVPVHSPTPATPVETAYSPLHHQQPQVIRGLWTLNINHLFFRRNQLNQPWGLVEWPWSFFDGIGMGWTPRHSQKP